VELRLTASDIVKLMHAYTFHEAVVGLFALAGVALSYLTTK